MTDDVIEMGGYQAVFKITGFKSRNTIKRLMDEKGFPRPYELVAGRKSFNIPQVKQWCRDQMNQQRGTAA